MLVLFFCILFGIICSSVAGTKGRSRVGWFFIGVLLGPIGIIWVLVKKADTATVEQRAIKSGESKKCPYCAELVKAEAIICKSCGKGFAGAPVAATPTPHPPRSAASPEMRATIEKAIIDERIELRGARMVAGGLVIALLLFSSIWGAFYRIDNNATPATTQASPPVAERPPVVEAIRESPVEPKEEIVIYTPGWCPNAATPMEIMICGDDDLSTADGAMYRKFLLAEQAAEDKRAFYAESRKWRTQVRDVCETKACALLAYAERIEYLSGKGDSLGAFITSLDGVGKNTADRKP